MEITTIQLDNRIKEKLEALKIHHRESYNEVISRLINNCSPKKKEVKRESLIATIEVLSDPETMRDIAEALEDYKRGKGIPLREVEKRLKL